jgi:hypothetical protein
MKRDNWPVEDYGIRPAGKSDECFYCGVKKGGVHKPECMIRERTIVVNVTIEMVVAVPENWSDASVEFSFNESSSCQSNIVERISDLAERREQNGSCMCGLIAVEYVGEADEKAEQEHLLFVKDLPS